jgi:hypothetical protein
MTLAPNTRSFESMQRNIPVLPLWDAEFPKQRMHVIQQERAAAAREGRAARVLLPAAKDKRRRG